MDLCRIGVAPDGQWYLGAGVGRGAWICPAEGCRSSLSIRPLEKALRRRVSLDDVSHIRHLFGERDVESVVRN